MRNIEQTLYPLRLAMCNSCTCLTKTPEYTFHASNCRHRLLREVELNVAKLVNDLEGEIRELKEHLEE